MATGRLGAVDMSASTYTSCYTNASTSAVVSVTICNRNATPVTVRLALSTTPTSPSSGEFIEYGAVIPANGILERTGLALSNAQSISVYSSATLVSVVTYGIEI
jgi:hypothetical protein